MRRSFFPLFACFFAAVSFASGKESEGLRFRIIASGEGEIIEAVMPDFITTELVRLIQTGVALTVRYEVMILRRGPLVFWPETVFPHAKRLEYDLKANVYVISSGAGSFKESSLKGALVRFRAPDRLEFPDGKWAVRPGDYRFRGRMRMETVKLYPPLSFIVGLLDIYNFTTRWMEIE